MPPKITVDPSRAARATRVDVFQRAHVDVGVRRAEPARAAAIAASI
jgi:hypothetical protein